MILKVLDNNQQNYLLKISGTNTHTIYIVVNSISITRSLWTDFEINF